MNNILITGPMNAGKTLLIQALMERIAHGLDGYTTHCERSSENRVYLRPLKYPDTRHLIARMNPANKAILEMHPEVFEDTAASIIENAQVASALIIDEIGFLEEGCENFQSALCKALDSPLLCICAVRKPSNEAFLQALLARGDARIVRLSANRKDADPELRAHAHAASLLRELGYEA